MVSPRPPPLFCQAANALEIVDILLLLIMLLDVSLRVLAFSWRYFKDAWNTFDALVLTISIVLGLVEAYYNSVRGCKQAPGLGVVGAW